MMGRRKDSERLADSRRSNGGVEIKYVLLRLNVFRVSSTANFLVCFRPLFIREIS